jgi:type IV secretory pathway VirB2 component (pilin)
MHTPPLTADDSRSRIACVAATPREHTRPARSFTWCTLRLALLVAAAIGLIPADTFAQGTGSPWENAVTVLMTSFTGPIARGLSLVAIVIGGITFAFGEGHSKRLVAGIVFGVGMAVSAVNFMTWLFPGS